MKIQQRSPVAISMLVLHWRWMGLGIVCLLVAFMLELPQAPAMAVPRRHSADSSPWARALQAVQSSLYDQSADQFTGLQDQPQAPATQSVIIYLRAHQVDHQSGWERVIARVRSYLHMQ